MKKSILLVTALVLMSACGFMKNATVTKASSEENTTANQTTSATTGTNTAQTAGQGVGSALLNLYNQYKADGNKYDYKNMQNIANTVNLIANCEGLKENYKDKTYLSEFGRGMVASSLGLVTQDNVESVTSSLVEMVKDNENVQAASDKVSSGANTAAGYANTAAQYASALSSILGAFGGR